MSCFAMFVYLTNRDCLTPVRGMVAHLRQCQEVDEIVIVDCGSTYPDLLDWYATTDATVVRCPNLGPQAPWQVMQSLLTADRQEYYAVSDADLDLAGVPVDVLGQLREGLLRYPASIKAGLSLAIDDFPEGAPLRAEVVAHESQFWQHRLDADWYSAAIDTTFAVYRQRSWGGYEPALRASPPYTARHLSWYLEPPDIPPDWKWYLENCAALTHWSGQYQQLLSAQSP